MEQMSRTDNLIFCYGLVVECWAVSSNSWSARVRKCQSFDWLGLASCITTRDGAITAAVDTAVKYLHSESGDCSGCCPVDLPHHPTVEI